MSYNVLSDNCIPSLVRMVCCSRPNNTNYSNSDKNNNSDSNCLQILHLVAVGLREWYHLLSNKVSKTTSATTTSALTTTTTTATVVSSNSSLDASQPQASGLTHLFIAANR